jgi:hypothetical protein
VNGPIVEPLYPSLLDDVIPPGSVIHEVH